MPHVVYFCLHTLINGKFSWVFEIYFFIVSGVIVSLILFNIWTTITIKNIAAASSPPISLVGNPQGENHQWVNPLFEVCHILFAAMGTSAEPVFSICPGWAQQWLFSAGDFAWNCGSAEKGAENPGQTDLTQWWGTVEPGLTACLSPPAGRFLWNSRNFCSDG